MLGMISTSLSFKCFPAVAGALLFTSASGEAATSLFTLDEVENFAHGGNSSNFSPDNPPTAGSQVLSNGTFSWGNLSTDGSVDENFARFAVDFGLGSFEASDWGGDGRYVSEEIDIDGVIGVEFSYEAATNFNNSPTEYFNFFYILDGNEIDVGATGEGTSETSSGTVSVGSGSTLRVGFEFNHNGADNLVNVSELNVVMVPEPSATIMLGLGMVGMLARRRR